MNATAKIDSTIENWEDGALGQDMDHAQPAPRELQRQIDEAQGMQAISIRLDKELIEQFKQIAKIHGMGYQPLMREALKRFAGSEIKIIIAKMANDSKKESLENGRQKVEVELKLELDQRHAA